MKKVLKVLVNVILWVFVACAAVVTIIVFTGSNNNGVGNLFGYIPLSIQTQSMEPTIKAGDMVIGKKVDYHTLKKGDIVTYWTTINNKKVLNTHRIVKISNKKEGTVWSFITKGDNNQEKDQYTISPGDIVAKYDTKISGFGKVVDFLETQKGFFICILLPLILFFLYQLYHFIKVIVSVNHGKGLSDEEEEALKQKAVEEYLAKQSKDDKKAQDAKVQEEPVQMQQPEVTTESETSEGEQVNS